MIGVVCSRCGRTDTQRTLNGVTAEPIGWADVTLSGMPMRTLRVCASCAAFAARALSGPPLVTDAMIAAFGDAWNDTPEGEPGDRRRAVLAAALALA